MQVCCVGGRIGVRSRRCMERVTVSTKSTRVGHAVQQCTCRRLEPMIEGGSPPPMVVAVKDDTEDVVAEGRRFGYGAGGMVRT